jgi:hypothetical protein
VSCDKIQGRVWERKVTGLLDLDSEVRCVGVVCYCVSCPCGRRMWLTWWFVRFKDEDWRSTIRQQKSREWRWR